MNQRPLAIDLFCGLFGWSEGLVAEGWRVVGFDLEDMCAQFSIPRTPHAQFVIQDVLTLHGSQFRNADLIVASPPCQEYSYMAMPWSRAKALAAEYRSGKRDVKQLTALFDACFRIQREACEASDRHIPLIVENVRGAIPWVGRSRWNYGSFHLWGDVPALMPPIAPRSVMKEGIAHRNDGVTNFHGHKNNGGSWFAIGSPGQKETSHNPVHELTARGIKGVPHRTNGHWTNPAEHGTKIGGDWFSDPNSTCRRHGSKSKGRKMASAMIAKIPLPLSRHIAATFR